MLLNYKKPEWNFIYSIWNYGLLKKNIGYLKYVLDIIHYKRIRDEANISPKKDTPYKYLID